jgi:NAD(P)-dependent dehydrogenase (short-subunit alcohol dehydrogenase family)
MGTDLTSSEREWNTSFDINVHAHRWAVKYLIDDWLAAEHGYFVSTASAAGLLTAIGSAPYSLTKHAALSFAEWLSITYGNRGLRVNGNVVRASGAVLEPEQVAKIVADSVRNETFLILPHPEVAQFVAKKATEHERWLAGMRKLQLRTLGV